MKFAFCFDANIKLIIKNSEIMINLFIKFIAKNFDEIINLFIKLVTKGFGEIIINLFIKINIKSLL